MTETQERFLRTILSRVPLESVVELHLFPPIRRGTLETGVAVIATVMPPALVIDTDTGAFDTDADASDTTHADALNHARGDAAAIEETDRDAADNVASAEPDETSDNVDAPAEVESAVVDEQPAAVDAAHGAEPDDRDDSSPYAADPAAVVTGDDGSAPQDDTEPVQFVPAASPRMRILTASYRHTIKGVERGKWVAEVQEEADAPLDAVEAVLRGVRHRSTEPADPELVSHETLAALLTPAAVAPAA